MHAAVHRRLGDLQIEVVGRRVQHGVVPAHRRAQRGPVLHIEFEECEAPAGQWSEQRGDTIGLQVSDGDPVDTGVLQQIVGAGGTLESRAQNQHAHGAIASGLR